VQTVPTPTPSRGTPVEPVTPSPVFTDDAPTLPMLDEPPTRPLVAQQPAPAQAVASVEHRLESAEQQDVVPERRIVAMVRAVRRQLPYALVLLTMAVGLVRIVLYHWREGSAWIGGALLLAALLRAVLPPRTAGMLVVRGRAVDVLWCTGLAVCILFVAYTLKA
jgi:Protein of unknown function (DUF3017)